MPLVSVGSPGVYGPLFVGQARFPDYQPYAGEVEDLDV